MPLSIYAGNTGFAIDAFAIYHGATTAAAQLGTPKGGTQINFGVEHASIQADGLFSPLVGNDRILKQEPVISTTLVGVTEANYAKLISGSVSTVGADTIIVPPASGDAIPAAAYLVDLRAVCLRTDNKFESYRLIAALPVITGVRGTQGSEREITVEFRGRNTQGSLPQGAYLPCWKIEVLATLTFPA